MYDFDERKKKLDVQAILRRIVDKSSPNLPPFTGENRGKTRCNRSLPVLLLPLQNHNLMIGEARYAITKDISSDGLGLSLMLPKPMSAETVIVGFWNDSNTIFFLGEVRQNMPIGGGFFQMGVQVMEKADPADFPFLARMGPLMNTLDPSQESAVVAST